PGSELLELRGQIIDVNWSDDGHREVRLANIRALASDGTAYTVPFADDNEWWELPARLMRLTAQAIETETQRTVQLPPREPVTDNAAVPTPTGSHDTVHQLAASSALTDQPGDGTPSAAEGVRQRLLALLKEKPQEQAVLAPCRD